jgi:hypothetical protein
MSLGAILVGIAMLILSTVVVLDPLLKEGRRREAGKSQGPSSPPRELEILQAIKDLDFDYQTGKLEEADYERLRKALVLEAAQRLQAAEERDAELERALEEAIARKRVRPQARPQAEVRAEGNHGHGAAQPESVAQFCTSCGNGLLEGDRFCSRCGHPAAGEGPP